MAARQVALWIVEMRGWKRSGGSTAHMRQAQRKAATNYNATQYTFVTARVIALDLSEE
jgi:hypothetical protein